jgi:arylsulfatase A-like enzyme
MDVLARHGLDENTILVLTTDHGIAMPLAKGTLYDPGLETYLMLRCPERWNGGARHDALVSNIDVLPTLLEACGIHVPGRIQGRSFLPLLEGQAFEPNEEIFAEKTFHGCYDPMRGVRTERYKYIRFFEKSSLHPVPGDIAFHGAYRELPPERFRRTAPEELYDLQADPGETRNLADDADHADLLANMRARLARWMHRTDDPLLRGPVASPYYHRAVAQIEDA